MPLPNELYTFPLGFTIQPVNSNTPTCTFDRYGNATITGTVVVGTMNVTTFNVSGDVDITGTLTVDTSLILGSAQSTLVPIGSHILGQKDGSPNEFRVYGGASNYISTAHDNTDGIIATSGNLKLSASSVIYPSSNNTIDFGVSATNTFKIGYFGTGLVLGANSDVALTPIGAHVLGLKDGSANTLRVYGDGTKYAYGLHDGTNAQFGASSGEVDIVGVASSAIRLNSSGADVDTIIQSDTNASAFKLDAGLNSGDGRIELNTVWILMPNLPTSSAGLATGTLWNNAGTVKVA